MNRLLMLLAVVVSALPAAGAAHPPAPPVPADLVLLDAHDAMHLFDPMTGGSHGMIATPGEPNIVVSAAAGSQGVLFVAIPPASEGGDTEILALASGSEAPETVGRVPGRATLAAVAADGNRLLLLERPPPTASDSAPPPTGIRELALPERWRQGSSSAAPGSDLGFGVLAPGSGRWHRLRRAEEGGELEPRRELLTRALRRGDKPDETTLPLPETSGYSALLLSPDAARLYLVDFSRQAIATIEAATNTVQRTVQFGEFHYKRPACAAALSPTGDRLYLLANSGSSNAGDGILVYDTASWQRLGLLLPGANLYCLAVSPDGDRLYATRPTGWTDPLPAGDPELVTIDARTGREQGGVPLNLGDCCAYVLAAVSPGETGESAG